MRVIVTGASGMIGSALCDALLVRGEEVVGLTRDPARARATNPTVSWHAWNPTDERPPQAALAGVDAVVNLIGETTNQRLTPAAKQRILDSRLRSTKNLVDGLATASTPPRVMVSQSAVGYYGERGEAIIDESAPPGSGFLAELPAAWEETARGAERLDLRLAILRTGIVLDPEGGMIKQLLLPFRLGVGGPLAGGDWYMPWIHRDDEVGLIGWALGEQRAAGVLNACAPHPVTNREFSTALGRVLRRPAITPAPKIAIAALRGGELAEAVTESHRAVPRRALDLGYSFRFPVLEPALRDLFSRRQ
ncbi:MAG: TIGR01777 family protein [Solirubrobacterales bacterium]|nr:TIGR01777 family protein [Solirubrobacterales bacterium]